MPIIKENVYHDIQIETVIYKEINGKELEMLIFKPEDWKAQDQRPAILFYFGGGFFKGNPSHFRMQAEYFAHIGMVTLTPNYRLTTEAGVEVVDCLKDAKSALRYVNHHAAELGIDRERIVVAGGSAGGAMASSAVLVTTLDEENESSVPCAMILYNPGLKFGVSQMQGDDEDTININGKLEKISEIKKHAGAMNSPELVQYSPMSFIRPNLPAALVIHGDHDRAVSVAVSEEFQQKMILAKNECELVVYPNRDHGFFNWNSSEEHICFYDTLNLVEEFLRRKQILNPGLRKKIDWK